MTYQVVKLTFLAALMAFAEPSPWSGSGASSGSSAVASSYAGSSANSYGGGQPGHAVNGATSGSTSYGGGGPNVVNPYPSSSSPGQAGSYQGSSKNAIPSGGGQGGNSGGGYGTGSAGGGYGTGSAGGAYGTSSSSGYASGYPGSGTGGSYSGTGGVNSGIGRPVGQYPAAGGSGGFGGSLPFNLPAGCFSGFPQYGQDPWQIHQQIMNNIQKIHEDSLRFGAPPTQTGSVSFTSTHHTSSVQQHSWSSRSKRYTGRNRNLNRNMDIKDCIDFIKRTMDSPQYSNFYRTEYRGIGGIPAASVGAFASGAIGPQGGYGQANVYPQEEGGLNIRFGDTIPEGPVQSVSGNIPPPSGGFYGVSTSSQSSSSNINGKVTSQKESSVTVNDNGKVTTYKAKSP